MNVDLTDLDAFEKGFPHEVFTRLRREAPVYWHEPTRHTPDGEGFWVVSRHADALLALLETGQWELLRARRELLPIAVEEIVRWTTPSVYKRRTVTRDVSFGGHTLRAGDKLTFWEMSANRDEAVFAEPFRFDVARDPNPHLGFGHGVHFCLGANLARLEIRVMLEELLESGRAIALAGDPVWTRDNRLFGLKHLPVRIDPERRAGSRRTTVTAERSQARRTRPRGRPRSSRAQASRTGGR